MIRKSTYKVLLTTLTVALLLLLAVSAWARGPANVTKTIHNLSITGEDPFWAPFPGGSIYKTDGEEVCVFCHTPHGGEIDTPLWNKPLDAIEGASVFTHYSNALLSQTMKDLPTNRAVNMESLLCLSCHDGSLSVNAVHNVSNAHADPNGYRTDGDPDYDNNIQIGLNARIGGAAGGDLSDDHPISFSYYDVLQDDYYKSGGIRDGELRTVADAVGWAGEGVQFFGDTGVVGGDRVECSSCHDPHVYYDYYGNNTEYAPFLIMPNTNSNLCFACHNK